MDPLHWAYIPLPIALAPFPLGDGCLAFMNMKIQSIDERR